MNGADCPGQGTKKEIEGGFISRPETTNCYIRPQENHLWGLYWLNKQKQK